MPVIRQAKKLFNLEKMLLYYWLVLITWQYVNPGKTGSTADTVVKISLILVLTIYIFTHFNHVSQNSTGILLFVTINLTISFFQETILNGRTILTYYYPIFIIFCTMIKASKYEMDKLSLINFFRIIIRVVFVMVCYAVIFTPEKFISFLSVSGAYGHELTSLFVSNHEYALYLCAAIIGCIICIFDSEYTSRSEKRIYFILIFVFFINLILTFSRSYIITTIFVLTIAVFLSNNSRVKNTYILLWVTVFIVILTVPQLKMYVLNIVFKENTLSGRDTLLSLALDFYKNSNAINKLWGTGTQSTSYFFRDVSGHSSVHNAYMQILLHYGLVNLISLLAFIIHNINRSFKLIRKNGRYGAVCTALSVLCLLPMLTTTVVVFTSPGDSYFVTLISILIPVYVGNAIRAGTFDSSTI